MFKRIFALLCALLLVTSLAAGAEPAILDFKAAQSGTDNWVETVLPDMMGKGGEWYVIALSQQGDRSPAGKCHDESVIRKVEAFNEAYRLVEKSAILNWFDVTAPEGFLSLNEKMGTVLQTQGGQQLFASMFSKMLGGGEGGGMKAMGFELNADMMSMMNGFTVLRLFTLMGGMTDVKLTKEQLLGINAQLNKIPKPQK